MKLISRKAITATIAAAAITTASMTAPAMAQPEPVETAITATAPAETEDTTTKDATTEDTEADATATDATPAANNKDKGSSEDVSGSSDGGDIAGKIKEVIGILTGVGAFFGAIITLTNNIQRLIKSFK